MAKKKEKKWAEKLKKHCHRTPCSGCALYSSQCRITNYPAPAYWDVGKKKKRNVHIAASLVNDGRSTPEEIAMALGVPIGEIRRCMEDIKKARKAAGIRMIEEEK